MNVTISEYRTNLKTMKEILKKGAVAALWISLFLTVTIVISIFKASDLRPSQSLNGLNFVDGGKYDSEKKVVVAYFWATWCGVCSANLPLIKWYADRLEGSFRFSFVTVEEGEDSKELDRYIREHDLKFKIIPANPYLLKEWKVNAYPSFAILDKTGTIRFADSGIMNPLSFFLRIWVAYFFF
ncbi:thioredoxin-like domain protein [Leptospira weilii serovar Topaz str. LT2116]|uniref:Thioredoxin-like domain protein n=1 Tax=Leptospira weilii serovar Topaz str. LT2116 TaxID=1088540 RepID=M3GTX2_9LEPT|nr:thioredoxin-like domain protein [Leptospira weilii serovar Topaz str. LT2116]